jgi:hypothetical protein
MHCSEEELLSHLDGELPPWRHVRVWLHLRSCWRCRTRLSASEQEIHRLAVAMDEWQFPPADWGPAAKDRLRLRMRAHERELEIAPPRRMGLAIPLAGAAGVVLALMFAWYFATSGTKAPIRAAEVIAHAAGVEATLYSQPVHQSFSVQIVEIRPVSKTVDSQLQIWSDRPNGRFASRLSGPDGELRHAMWQPAESREIVYHQGGKHLVERQRHAVEAASLASLAEHGLESDQIESAFMHWIESRSWSPISLSSDISAWVATDGTIATAERLSHGDGKPSIRITARRKTRTMVAVLSLDVDSTNYQPRLETIRFEAADRIVEFRLVADSVRKVSRAELSPAVFRPDPALESGTSVPTETAGPAGSRALSVVQPKPRLNAVDLRELQAQYALHKAGACLGEAVQVNEESGGIRIVHTGEGGGEFAGVSMDFVLRALAELRREPPASIPSGSALALALRHAWALKGLGSFFSSRQTPEQTDQAWPLLAAMVRDHRVAMERELERAGVRRPGTSGQRFEGDDWREPADALFPSLMRLSDSGNLHGAGGDLLTAIYRHLDELQAAFPDAGR